MGQNWYILYFFNKYKKRFLDHMHGCNHNNKKYIIIRLRDSGLEFNHSLCMLVFLSIRMSVIVPSEHGTSAMPTTMYSIEERTYKVGYNFKLIHFSYIFLSNTCLPRHNMVSKRSAARVVIRLKLIVNSVK